LLRARLYEVQRRYEKALDDYLQAAAARPESLEATLGVARN